MDMSANDGLEFSLMQFDEEASRQSEDFLINHLGTMSNNSTGSPHPLLGHSVRDFEMQLSELRKENFNLKLRVYFLEEKNPNVLEGEQCLYKQNIDLKILNETLEKELQDKQQLCVEASKAMELLDDQQRKEHGKHSMVVDELNQKIESITHEVKILQEALSEQIKGPVGNDTGFTDFIGALDTKDVDNQQKMVELEVVEKKLNGQLSAMTETVYALKTEKNLLSSEIEELKYDNSSLKEQIDNFVKSKSDDLKNLQILRNFCSQKTNDLNFSQIRNEYLQKKNKKLNDKYEILALNFSELSSASQSFQNYSTDVELQTFKDLWAETKCDLNDCQTMLKEKESELEDAVKFIQKSVNHLAENRAKIQTLEAELAGSVNGDMSSVRAIDINMEAMKAKDDEITKLKVELKQSTQNLQGLVNKELWEKNREIEKLNKMVNSLQTEKKTLENSSFNSTQNHSFDVLADSYNDQKYQEALELKKKAQNEMKRLLKELYNSAGNVKTRDQIKKLEMELQVVVEQQVVTETTLNKCTELCALTMEQLHELAIFLSTLINQANIQVSLSDITLKSVRSCVNKSLEMSKSLNGSRFSLAIGDTSLIQLGDWSNLDSLINTARDSLCNFRQVNVEANTLSKVNSEFLHDSEQVHEKLFSATQEVENFSRVNQMLEDEICQYKEELEKLTKTVSDDFEQLKTLKEEKNRLCVNLRVIEGKFEAQGIEVSELKVDKTQRQKEYVESLKKIKAAFESDILLNYIHKDEHASVRHKIEEELKIKEANMQGMILEMNQMKKELLENEKNILVVQNNFECITSQLSKAATEYAALTNENSSLIQQINELCEHKALHESEVKIESPNTYDSSISCNDSEEKENHNSTIEKTQLKTLEISEDRKQILLSTTISNSSTVLQYEQSTVYANCAICKKNEAKIIELKQRLLNSYDKLRSQNEIKAENERIIKKQIIKTRNVLAHAHSNMEQIIKSRNNAE